jgi:hypothetical protein
MWHWMPTESQITLPCIPLNVENIKKIFHMKYVNLMQEKETIWISNFMWSMDSGTAWLKT